MCIGLRHNFCPNKMNFTVSIPPKASLQFYSYKEQQDLGQQNQIISFLTDVNIAPANACSGLHCRYCCCKPYNLNSGMKNSVFSAGSILFPLYLHICASKLYIFNFLHLIILLFPESGTVEYATPGKHCSVMESMTCYVIVTVGFMFYSEYCQTV